MFDFDKRASKPGARPNFRQSSLLIDNADPQHTNPKIRLLFQSLNGYLRALRVRQSVAVDRRNLWIENLS
jgi:hypothetical protein